MSTNINKWDYRFLRIAREVATYSKDPSTKVGCLLVAPDRSRWAVGYNGFPRDMEDRPEWYENREEKYSRIIHAEKNAKANAHCDVRGWTQYTWPFSSCDRCFVEMQQEGIVRFVAPIMSAEIATRWGPIVEKVRKYVEEMKMSGIDIIFDELDFPTTLSQEI